MNLLELYWLAGWFEGEGSIHFDGNRITLSVSSTDEDTIDKAISFAKIGLKFGPYSKEVAHHKDYWRWQVSRKREALALLLAFYPLMGTRRREQFSKVFNEWVLFQLKKIEEKKFCKRGHARTSENVNSLRQCKTCIRDRKKEQYWEKKHALSL